MKRIFLALLSLSILTMSCEAQPKVKTVVNDANAVKRNVGNFDAINVSSAIQVYLSQGDECAIAVSCSEPEKMNEIITEVNGGILTIKMNQSFWDKWGSDLKVKAYVTLKNISSIKVSGASSVKINESLETEDLNIKASGASSIKGKIKAKNFTASISGASTVNLIGGASKANIDCSGASTFKSFDFVTDKCKITSSGASNVSVTVTNDIDADASGASSIRYAGNPQKVVVDETGASSVKRKDLSAN